LTPPMRRTKLASRPTSRQRLVKRSRGGQLTERQVKLMDNLIYAVALIGIFIIAIAVLRILNGGGPPIKR
jgi:hypothetical protein